MVRNFGRLLQLASSIPDGVCSAPRTLPVELEQVIARWIGRCSWLIIHWDKGCSGDHSRAQQLPPGLRLQPGSSVPACRPGQGRTVIHILFFRYCRGLRESISTGSTGGVCWWWDCASATRIPTPWFPDCNMIIMVYLYGWMMVYMCGQWYIIVYSGDYDCGDLSPVLLPGFATFGVHTGSFRFYVCFYSNSTGAWTQ